MVVVLSLTQASRCADDMRQVSGYARLEAVFNQIKQGKDTLIDCLSNYSDEDNGPTLEEFKEVDLKKQSIKCFDKVL